MKNYVNVFVQNCLHSVATISGNKVPHPLVTQRHATKPIKISHSYVRYIGLSRDRKYKYILLLKDDLSGYLCLMTCLPANFAATVEEIMR
jgi:hypothetical protein